MQAYNEFYNSAFGHTLKPGDHRKAVQAALVGHGRGGGGGIKRGGAGAMGMGMQLQYNEPGKEAVEALFFLFFFIQISSSTFARAHRITSSRPLTWGHVPPKESRPLFSNVLSILSFTLGRILGHWLFGICVRHRPVSV